MIRYVITGILMVFLSLGLAYFDRFNGVSKSAGWTIVVFALGFLATFLPVFRRQRSVKALMCSVALFAIFSAGIVTLRQIDADTPRGKFMKVYWNIRPGMTTLEVEAVVRREFPTVQPSILWNKNGGFLGLEPVDKDYGIDKIELWLDKGVITGARYLPD